jgi:hypothetical protein
MGNKVMLAAPGFVNPLFDASEVTITGRNAGRISAAAGYGSHGEPVRCKRSKSGRITEVWLGATQLLPAAKIKGEMEARYDKPKARRRPKRAGR